MTLATIHIRRIAAPFIALIILFIFLTLGTPETVSATTIDSLSPGELVSGADLVVIAECINSGLITARYRVDKIYKGDLKAGDTFVLRIASTSSGFTEGLAGQHYFITAWEQDKNPPSRIMSMSMPRNPISSPPTFSSFDYITPLYQGRIPLTRTADDTYRYIGRRPKAGRQFRDFEAVIPKFIDSPLKTEYLLIDFIQTKVRDLISYDDFSSPENDAAGEEDVAEEEDVAREEDAGIDIPDDRPAPDDDDDGGFIGESDEDNLPEPDCEADGGFDDFGEDDFGADDLEEDGDDFGEDYFDDFGPDDFDEFGFEEDDFGDDLDEDGDEFFEDDFGDFGDFGDDNFGDDFGEDGFDDVGADDLDEDGDEFFEDDFGDFGADDLEDYGVDVVGPEDTFGDDNFGDDGWVTDDFSDDEFDEADDLDHVDDLDHADGFVPQDDSSPDVKPAVKPEIQKEEKKEEQPWSFLDEVEESYARGEWRWEPMHPWQKVVAEIALLKWLDDETVARLYQKVFAMLKELPECHDKRRIIQTLCHTGAPPLVDIVLEQLRSLTEDQGYERSNCLSLLLKLAQHPDNLPRIKEETRDMDLPEWFTGKPPEGAKVETYGPDDLTMEEIKALPWRARQELGCYEMIKSMRHPKPHPNDVYQLTKKGMNQEEAEKKAPPTWRVPYHFELEHLDDDLRDEVARVAWETMPADLPQWKKLDAAVQLSVCRSEANTAYLEGLINDHFDLLTADSIPEDVPMENDPDDLMKALFGLSISVPEKVFDFCLRLKRLPQSWMLSNGWMRAATSMAPQLGQEQLEAMLDRGVDDFKVLASREVHKRFPSDNKLVHKARRTLSSVASNTGTPAAVQADLVLVAMGDKEAVPRLLGTFKDPIESRQAQYRMMIVLTNLSYGRNPPDITAWYDFQHKPELEDIWRRWWKENKHRITSEELVKAAAMEIP